MLLVKTSIRLSGLHGIGLFAVEFIAAGTEIAAPHHRLDLVFGTNLNAIYPPALRDIVRHYGYHDSVDLLWHLPGDNLRFLNHSPAPNVIQVGERDVTARDIQAGEELTVDYWSFDLDAAWKLRGTQHDTQPPFSS